MDDHTVYNPSSKPIRTLSYKVVLTSIDKKDTKGDLISLKGCYELPHMPSPSKSMQLRKRKSDAEEEEEEEEEEDENIQELQQQSKIPPPPKVGYI